VLPADPLDELRVPDETRAEEHDLVTDANVVIGGQGTVSFGVRGAAVMTGERVRIGGDIEAENDCRLDVWSAVEGNVLVGEDAYVGERVSIDGELKVAGDLDIGDDVEIADGFEASGWIVIRNPMPTVVFLVVYLSHLLRLGEEEAAERLASQFGDAEVDVDDADGDNPDLERIERAAAAVLSDGVRAPGAVSGPLIVPRGATVSDDAWRVGTPARIGRDCRLHGNVRATAIEVGGDTEIYGSLRAREGIVVGRHAVVHGDVTTRDGEVRIAPGAQVRGDVACDDLAVADAEVEGASRARGEVTMGPTPSGG
jgi:predicted acyltransferase (DUF342 family)